MWLRSAFRLLRPKQWTKNLLVFAALIFAKLYTGVHFVLTTLEAFAALCLISSTVYIVNDILDVERDRVHPVKKKRPIAAGQISVQTAWILAAVCFLGGVGISIPLGKSWLAGIGLYFLLQVGYNLYFKRQAILDVFVLAFGFVLRAAVGAMPIGASISGWLLFCTGALALLLGFSKRRNEFLMQSGEQSRPALANYNIQLLNSMVIFAASIAAMSYGVYAIESRTGRDNPALILTTPFVIYGIARYVYLTFALDEGGEPENLVFGDPHMLVAIVLFVATAFFALTGVSLPFIGDHA